MSDGALQKIGEVEVAGKKYDLAKNGSFRLVENYGEDAYGRPIARVETFESLGDFSRDIVQSLLDLLGDALLRLRQQRDSRLGNGGED